MDALDGAMRVPPRRVPPIQGTLLQQAAARDSKDRKAINHTMERHRRVTTSIQIM
jgi:hypothetical protein